MHTQSDESLYHQMRGGDEQALETLYDKYERLLFSFAHRFTNNDRLSEEVIQEVWMKIWNGRVDFNTEKGKFSSWVLTITRNAALDCLRREKRQPTIEIEERDGGFDEPVERTVVERETASEVREAVQALKPEQQELIELVYFKGLTQQQISDQLELPLGTVKTRIRSAIQALRKLLEGRER
ncbi:MULTISPECIES: sigma-70 family RNA polymerase sigma factor [Exiguobacterium]|uniref:RNA polymerase subunit sigma-24 n=1 Tax=Exiguobacterium oxidotolerans TaxID=223958 RepID=A0A653I7Z3_9BACL|nr:MULTISPECIES: sigma-70 family RNA polymerase sigma factor [Exiguobacterium]ASI36361.1 RNA polymerase subunit sigma-24 [Exiguobacterium sp. N4-1P]VWX35164.1 RNA polymerase subunit sigma-24 [Exiguobacterium oxidotolerans]